MHCIRNRCITSNVRGAASAAHVYGKRIVAAESLHRRLRYESPYSLKKIADYWFAQGINRLVFHTSAHQPLDTKPGNIMVGTHINRNITWAEQARPFMTYVARVSYMLQQGSPVADSAYLLPEGAPSTMPFWGSGLQPAPPRGYDYDYINTDILLHHTSVTTDGSIHVDGSHDLPDGMIYRLLVLPPTTEMTPEVLRKLHELVTAGATISGPRPLSSPSLLHYPDADAEVHSLATDLWGAMDGVTLNQHSFGRGTTYFGLSIDEILTRLKTSPDFASSKPLENPPVWVHRHVPDAEIYFVANQADTPREIDARFRVAGKDVQIWRPMDGSMTGDRPDNEATYTSVTHIDDRSGNRQPGLQPAAYTTASGFTAVQLHLAARESVFVVFRNAVLAPSRTASAATETTLATLDDSWTINFPANLGAPPTVAMPKLISWTDSTVSGVKYFSGTATYARTIEASAKWFHPGQRIWLDLGEVRDIAEVTMNGKPVGYSWAPPDRLDITNDLHPGLNKIEIAVTNEWTNRQIGDSKVPEAERVLPPNVSLFGNANGPLGRPQVLEESGLLGDVRLIAERTAPSAAP